MGRIRFANQTHYKDWTAKLQRVWRKDDDEDGVITIIEDLMVPDEFTVHIRGKQYAKVEPPADMDSAIHVAELSYMAWGLGPKGTKDVDKEVGEHLKALLGPELKEVPKGVTTDRTACCDEDNEFTRRSIEEAAKEETPVSIRGECDVDEEDKARRSECQKKE